MRLGVSGARIERFDRPLTGIRELGCRMRAGYWLPAVRTTGPRVATMIVCSSCALAVPSRVRTVQPSRSSLSLALPEVSIGSIVNTSPGVSRWFACGAGQLKTVGGSCIRRPMPCPVSSLKTSKPRAFAVRSIAAPTSRNLAPGCAARIPAASDARVASSSRSEPRSAAPTGTVIAASA